RRCELALSEAGAAPSVILVGDVRDHFRIRDRLAVRGHDAARETTDAPRRGRRRRRGTVAGAREGEAGDRESNPRRDAPRPDDHFPGSGAVNLRPAVFPDSTVT